MTEFTTWAILATYAGAVAMTGIITQATKKQIDKLFNIPTQLYSYIVALLVLYASYYFTNQLDASNAVLILFNGVIVSIASNGSFDFAKRVKGGK